MLPAAASASDAWILLGAVAVASNEVKNVLECRTQTSHD